MPCNMALNVRLNAVLFEAGRAVSAGSYYKSEVQQVNVTQRKALGANTAVTNVLLFDKALAGLAMGALRSTVLSRKRQSAC